MGSNPIALTNEIKNLNKKHETLLPPNVSLANHLANNSQTYTAPLRRQFRGLSRSFCPRAYHHTHQTHATTTASQTMKAWIMMPPARLHEKRGAHAATAAFCRCASSLGSELAAITRGSTRIRGQADKYVHGWALPESSKSHLLGSPSHSLVASISSYRV
jgi:hypothetical protein